MVLNEIAAPIVPAGTSRFTLAGELVLLGRCPSSQASLAELKSASSIHIRCRMTASFLATAIFALAMPRRLATASPQTRRADHLLPRARSVCAASTSPVRASSSPQRLILPTISVSPD